MMQAEFVARLRFKLLIFLVNQMDQASRDPFDGCKAKELID